MRWFGKNKKEKSGREGLAKLPELPKIPQLDNKSEDILNGSISQLPSYPSSSFGEKFSQNAIKEAVTGKVGDEEVFDANESLDEFEDGMMHEPHKSSTEEINSKRVERNIRSERIEPVFVRIDKFEEALKIFGKTRDKISEIEKLLEEMKRINEKEEKELQSWEKEVQGMKKNFEKINQDIFSKL